MSDFCNSPGLQQCLPVVTIAIGPIYPIAITLLYYDQRIRHEAFDLEQMMKAAGMTGDPVRAGDGSQIAVSSIEPVTVQPE
jgi:hypothetical protein